MTPFDDIPPEDPLADLLDQMRTLLVNAVEGGSSARESAVTYLDLRSALLSSEIGGVLPGFLYQCRTVMRFCDFISLYDPDIDLRIAFIDRMIGRCRALLEPRDRFPENRGSRNGAKPG